MLLMRAYSRIYLPTMRINKKAATAQESSDIACTCFPAKRDMLCDGDHGSFLVFLGRQYATRTRSHSLHHAQRRRFGLGIRVASAASQLAADERCVAAATFSRLPISESGASRFLQARREVRGRLTASDAPIRIFRRGGAWSDSAIGQDEHSSKVRAQANERWVRMGCTRVSLTCTRGHRGGCRVPVPVQKQGRRGSCARPGGPACCGQPLTPARRA